MGPVLSATRTTISPVSGEISLSYYLKKQLATRFPDFTNTPQPVTVKQIELIEESWELVSQGTDIFKTSKEGQTGDSSITPVSFFYDRFFEHLFETYPEAKPIFRQSMILKSRALINIVQSIKGVLKSKDMFEKVVRLAERHVKYGVKLEDFNALGKSLVATIQYCCGTAYRPEMDAAWKSVYAYLVCLMTPTLVKAEDAAFAEKRREILSAMISNQISRVTSLKSEAVSRVSSLTSEAASRAGSMKSEATKSVSEKITPKKLEIKDKIVC